MASTRQKKHHTRFHAAVLRYLFPPSPPRSSHLETAHQSCEDISFQAQSPKFAEVVDIEEKCSDHADESMEVGKASISRAQRKRLKLKKLKEGQSGAMSAKRFIGPSLPDALEKRWHEDNGSSTAAKNICNARDLKPEEKDGHHGTETEPLSKAKRRRLAKKKFQDSLQRSPRAGSSFTAEIKGGDVVIKQMV